MIRLCCDLHIISKLDIEGVAAIISERLFGGAKFVGRERYIYDEVPAIFLEQPILGLRIVLQGFGGDDGYFLEMRDTRPLGLDLSSDEIRKSVVVLSQYVETLLEGNPELSVRTPKVSSEDSG
jgi:hypothetical protein